MWQKQQEDEEKEKREGLPLISLKIYALYVRLFNVAFASIFEYARAAAIYSLALSLSRSLPLSLAFIHSRSALFFLIIVVIP